MRFLEKIDEMKTMMGRLQRSGPYLDKQVEEARLTSLAYLNALIQACEESVRSLRVGKDWKSADEEGLQEKWKEAEKRRSAWRELFK